MPKVKKIKLIIVLEIRKIGKWIVKRMIILPVIFLKSGQNKQKVTILKLKVRKNRY